MTNEHAFHPFFLLLMNMLALVQVLQNVHSTKGMPFFFVAAHDGMCSQPVIKHHIDQYIHRLSDSTKPHKAASHL